MSTTTKSPHDPVRVARAQLASASRFTPDDAQKITHLRQELKAARLERAIQEAINAAPPLSPERRTELAAMLAAGGRV